jgi:hypothetical protein
VTPMAEYWGPKILTSTLSALCKHVDPMVTARGTLSLANTACPGSLMDAIVLRMGTDR